MPRAIPLGRTHYVQLVVYPAGPGKPRFETEAWTQEFKKPFRHGQGSVARLGRLGLHIGKWTGRYRETTGSAASVHGLPLSSSDEGVRLITEDEIETVSELVRQGWASPVWHWRHWLDRSLPLLQRLDVVRVSAYAENQWHWPRWAPQPERVTLRKWRKPVASQLHVFDGAEVTEGWEPVPAMADCGPACASVHTGVPPCLWSAEAREEAVHPFEAHDASGS